MPKIVEHVITASQVKKGDRVHNNGGTSAPVHSILNGRRWVTAKDDADHIVMRLEHDNPVRVSREEPTDEEKAAVQAAYRAHREERREENIQSWLDEGDADYERTLAKQTEALRVHYYSNSSSAFEVLMKAEAEHRIISQVRAIREHSPEMTARQAFDAWSAQFKRSLLGQHHNHNRALSRSTSVVSNLLDDVQVEVGFAIAENWMLRSLDEED